MLKTLRLHVVTGEQSIAKLSLRSHCDHFLSHLASKQYNQSVAKPVIAMWAMGFNINLMEKKQQLAAMAC
jgi:hypothetical protein